MTGQFTHIPNRRVLQIKTFSNPNLQRKADDSSAKKLELDNLKNVRNQKTKALQIENDKLRMELSNQTNHGHTLEMTIQNLTTQLENARNSNQQQAVQQSQNLLNDLNHYKKELMAASQEKAEVEEENFRLLTQRK